MALRLSEGLGHTRRSGPLTRNSFEQFIKCFWWGRPKIDGQFDTFRDHLGLAEKVNHAIETFTIGVVRVLRIEPAEEPVFGDFGNFLFRQTADGDDNPVPDKRADQNIAVPVRDGDRLEVYAGGGVNRRGPSVALAWNVVGTARQIESPLQGELPILISEGGFDVRLNRQDRL